MINKMRADNQQTAEIKAKKRQKMAGISMIEVIIVFVIIAVLTAISIPYVFNYQKLYKSEDQALKLMDLMREASQLALTKRRTMRFEIDLSENRVFIIDGKGAGNADDVEIKSIPIELPGNVRMETAPKDITKPNPPNYNDAAFVTDSVGHLRDSTSITGHKVWQLAFRSDGSVVNPVNSNPVSATLFLWEPKFPTSTTDFTPSSPQEVRAITIFGGTGAVRYWKHNGTTFKPY